MAINYDELFQDIGVFVAVIDELRGTAIGGAYTPDIPARLTEVRNQLTNTGSFEELNGVDTLFQSIRDNQTANAQNLASHVQTMLTNRNRVLNELSSTLEPSNIREILEEISRNMITQNKTVQSSGVTITTQPVPATNPANKGNGTVFISTTLDGVTPPVQGALPSALYAGVLSEMSVPNEFMVLTCTADSDNSGTGEGNEVFRLEGKPGFIIQGLDWRTEGSGSQIDVPVLNSYDYIANRDFEVLNVNSPINWTIVTGAPGVEIIAETDSAQVQRGSQTIRFVGTGTDIEMNQQMGIRTLTPLQRYCLSVAVKGDATANGTLTIDLQSVLQSSFTMGTGKITVSSAQLQAGAGGYTIYKTEWGAPANIPSDLRWVIKYTGATAGTIRIDSLAFGPFVYANGVGVAIIANDQRFTIGDRFIFQITNTEGKFQRFFRRYFRRQLPSSFAPNISDSWAE